MGNRKKIVIDFDDFNVSSVEFKILQNIKEHIPNFKVSLFTTPMHPWLMEDPKRFAHFMDWAQLIKDNSDWIEICVHGFLHDKSEMMTDYKNAKATILASEKAFTKFKIKQQGKLFKRWKWYEPNIPYKKIFKAAGWQMSKEAYEAARDLGYVVATDRNRPDIETKDLKTYRFNWSIEEPMPEDYEVIKGHGHMLGMANDLQMNYQKLLQDLPQDAEYLFISEYMDKYDRS